MLVLFIYFNLILLYLIFLVCFVAFRFILVYLILFVDFILFYFVYLLVIFLFSNEERNMHEQEMDLSTCAYRSLNFCQQFPNTCWEKTYLKKKFKISFFYFILYVLFCLFIPFYLIHYSLIFIFQYFFYTLFCPSLVEVAKDTKASLYFQGFFSLFSIVSNPIKL